MSAFALPASPTYRVARFGLVGNAARFASPITRVSQTVSRKGSFWRAQIELPPIVDSLAAGEWAAAIARLAAGEACLLRPPFRRALTGIGTPRVNGAGQWGSSLVIDGVGAGFVFRPGDAFGVTDSVGARVLHVVTATATASGGGAATLAIQPEIRRALPDNAVLDFATPSCEMELQGEADVWSLTDAIVYGVTLNLMERVR